MGKLYWREHYFGKSLFSGCLVEAYQGAIGLETGTANLFRSPHIDMEGIACLKGPGLLIYVVGQPRPAELDHGKSRRQQEWRSERSARS
jgi:hypothetical protein